MEGERSRRGLESVGVGGNLFGRNFSIEKQEGVPEDRDSC